MNTLAERSDALRQSAYEKLLETLGPKKLWMMEERPELNMPTPVPSIWAFTRYRSRSGETRIVDFIVIRDNRPVSISGDINALLPTTERNFSIPPGEYFTGIVLGKKSPEDVVKELSVLLLGRDCLKLETL